MTQTSDISPAFAREASQLLLDDEVERAIEMCVRGTMAYPSYSTGHMILGKSYEAAGRLEEAVAAYRQALTLLPDSPMLIELAKKAEQERYRVQPQSGFERKSGTAAGEAVRAAEPSNQAEESTIDYLARRLQNVKGFKPNAVSDQEANVSNPDNPKNGGFVTATIAEIYVGQGEYKEAIAAYNELIRQNPAEEKYRARLAEIEHLMKLESPSNEKAS